MHQLIIVGAGPAGLTAGLYAHRFKLDYIIIGQTIGGTALEAHRVDNYPGVLDISGPELIKKFTNQIDKNLIKKEDIRLISKKKNCFEIETYQNNKYQSQAIILALGTKFRKLDIASEAKYLGKGISYCVSCDAPFAEGKIAAVVGGGDSALTAALKLSDIACKVYLIHRRNEFRGAPALVEKVKTNSNIEIVYSANVVAAKGNNYLDEIVLDNKKKIKVNWLFIEIGGQPALNLCRNLNLQTENDYLVVDKNQATNIAGVYAAGDITICPFKQIVTACGQGATSANSAYSYIKSLSSAQ